LKNPAIYGIIPPKWSYNIEFQHKNWPVISESDHYPPSFRAEPRNLLNEKSIK